MRIRSGGGGRRRGEDEAYWGDEKGEKEKGTEEREGELKEGGRTLGSHRIVAGSSRSEGEEDFNELGTEVGIAGDAARNDANNGLEESGLKDGRSVGVADGDEEGGEVGDEELGDTLQGLGVLRERVRMRDEMEMTMRMRMEIRLRIG